MGTGGVRGQRGAGSKRIGVCVDARLSPGLGAHWGCGTQSPLSPSAPGGDRDGDLSRRGGPDPAGVPGLPVPVGGRRGGCTKREGTGWGGQRPQSPVCRVGVCAAAPGEAGAPWLGLHRVFPLSTPTRGMRPPTPDPAGRHPWGIADLCPVPRERDVWPALGWGGWGGRRRAALGGRGTGFTWQT